jgi:hypothetical protein
MIALCHAGKDGIFMMKEKGAELCRCSDAERCKTGRY